MTRVAPTEVLARMVAERAASPFSWGGHDCCLWAADVVQALTGVDLAADVRGRYRSAMQAARLLRAHGGVAGLAAARLGVQMLPLRARAGDVLLLARGCGGRYAPRHDTLAVCAGAHWLAPAPVGLASGPLHSAVAAWSVEALAWR